MQHNPGESLKDQTAIIEFLKEAEVMHRIDHDAIVRMYGVVLETNSLMLVSLSSE